MNRWKKKFFAINHQEIFSKKSFRARFNGENVVLVSHKPKRIFVAQRSVQGSVEPKRRAKITVS